MRPNILYIHSHDTGRWVEPYGWPVHMPVYSRFAREGLVLRNAHCAGPTCSPSRAGLLTGMHPHSAGLLGLSHRGFALRDVRQHLIHTLHGAGYTSHLAGIQHVMPQASDVGYSGILTERHYEAVPKALAFLAQVPAEPFFLDVGLFETHRPFPVPDHGEDPRYLPAPAVLPDTPEIRRDVAAYNTMARILDHKVGQVLGALEAAGLADRTVVIITTDHGPAFPLMKCNLTAQGTGVLFMMRGPGIPAGVVSDALISQIDLFPTLCEMLELPKPAWLQGRSFMPVVRGLPDPINEAIFSEVTYHAAYEPQRVVRTATHSYLRRFGDRPQPVLPNCDEGFSKTAMLATAWPTSHLPREELYDLGTDPLERHNRAGDPAYVGVLAQLRGRLDRWMAATDDPLCAGQVEAPLGAKVCDVDAPRATEGIFMVGPQHRGQAALHP